MFSNAYMGRTGAHLAKLLHLHKLGGRLAGNATAHAVQCGIAANIGDVVATVTCGAGAGAGGDQERGCRREWGMRERVGM